MKRYLLTFLTLTTFLIIGCGGGGTSHSSSASVFSSSVSPVTSGSWYKPTTSTTWQIQLADKDDSTDELDVNTSYTVDAYEFDLFEVTSDIISDLHNDNKKVICYFSAGSYEDWREDASLFSSSVIGEPLDGWPGEYWLDISNDELASIMKSRLDLAVSKGCDAVEFDNIDTYTQNSGFNLTYDDQLAYNMFLANEARSRGIAAGLKNDLNQINDLVSYFDFAVNEECHLYNECDTLTPFIQAGKPVFNIEYPESYIEENEVYNKDDICNLSSTLGLFTLIMPMELDDSSRITCD